MKILYSSPNRPIHYHYAIAFERMGYLHAFISGFPRFSPRAPLPQIGKKLIRRDQIQCLYIASQRIPFIPKFVSDFLGWASKVWLDFCSLKLARESDIFMFYNGAGIHTCKRLRNTKTIKIVEVVNSHVLNQDKILRDEYKICGFHYEGIYKREVKTRLAEYEEADFILCPSEFVRRSFIERGFAPEKIIKNPFGFEKPAEIIPELKSPKSCRILYVGSLSIRKGLRYLIEAFSELQHPNKELWLVGPAQRTTGLENIMLPPEVIIKGELKGKDLAMAYTSSDIFILPSVEEGLALVMGEALAYGLPVIATENTGASDLLNDGVEGFIVPIRDSKAIANRIIQLIQDPSLRNKMSIAARNRANTLAGWSRSGEKLVQHLSEIWNARRNSA